LAGEGRAGDLTTTVFSRPFGLPAEPSVRILVTPTLGRQKTARHLKRLMLRSASIARWAAIVTLISKYGGMLGSGVLRLLPRQRVFVPRYRRLPWAPGVAVPSLRRLGFPLLRPLVTDQKSFNNGDG
jgi:hypothetical protein